MTRALPVVLSAVLAALAAHVVGVPTAVTVVLGAAAAGAAGGVLVLRRDRFALTRDGAPVAARADLVGVVGAAFPVFAAWIVANVVLNPDVFDHEPNLVFTPK
ncbi:hypothetical protein, partial [uncultured Amnibacterium sp.]|uniref:hypothetical protein n=1 Tax=uncultured Amnibacterium sp. TaxID=1631851 RepID=UPI0035CAABD9